jgi:hypothetical protein
MSTSPDCSSKPTMLVAAREGPSVRAADDQTRNVRTDASKVARPRSRRSGIKQRLRIKRQNRVLLAVTTVVGLWLGISAPSVSPVAPPNPAAATRTAVAQAAAVVVRPDMHRRVDRP